MMNSVSPSLIDLQWFGDDKAGEGASAATTAAAESAGKAADKGSPPASLVEMLPEDLRSYSKFAELGSVDKLARSYVEAEKKIGNSLIRPGKDAKPEEWDRFYSTLGRPKTAEEYALTPPEGFEADPSFITRRRADFHAAGLTPAQANRVFNGIAEDAIAAQRAESEASAQALVAAETALKAKWGPKYDANLARATQFVEAVGGASAIKTLEELGVASHPLLLELFARAGEATSGKTLIKGKPTPDQKSRYAYMNEGKTHPD